MSDSVAATAFTPSFTGLRPRRRRAVCAAVVVLTLAMGGCASFNQVAVDVAGFGGWPAGRAPGTFVIDPLPSQRAVAEMGSSQAAAEAALTQALLAAGFKPAASVAEADVLARVGVRWTRVLEPGYGVGLGWGMGVGRGYYGRFGMGVGSIYSPFGWRTIGPDPVYERSEVELLLTDRASAKVLYESRSQVDGRTVRDGAIKPMVDAALAGFPQLAAGKRRVVMTVAPN